MRCRVGIVLGLAGFLALPVWADEKMYRCVDASGKTIYTNVAEDPRQCKAVDLAPDVSIPPPQVPAERPKTPRNDEAHADLQSRLKNEQQALEQARQALEEQRAVRYGNEKNYQKVLDRLKPYEEAVANHERQVKSISDEISKLP